MDAILIRDACFSSASMAFSATTSYLCRTAWSTLSVKSNKGGSSALEVTLKYAQHCLRGLEPHLKPWIRARMESFSSFCINAKVSNHCSIKNATINEPRLRLHIDNSTSAPRESKVHKRQRLGDGTKRQLERAQGSQRLLPTMNTRYSPTQRVRSDKKWSDFRKLSRALFESTTDTRTKIKVNRNSKTIVLEH